VNVINVIELYKKDGFWCFDDSSTGLKAEPFMTTATHFIDIMLNKIGKRSAKKPVAVFSKTPFPEHQFTIERVCDDGVGGTFYSYGGIHELWLCPALLKYFETAPSQIFIQVKA